jgi:D-serine deaminase-like pyridoxal phosphate-dependent protein
LATAKDLDTPVVIIDPNIVEANITRLQEYPNGHGIKNQPHIKTHKISAIACQKIGEAEVAAAAGIRSMWASRSRCWLSAIPVSSR